MTTLLDIVKEQGVVDLIEDYALQMEQIPYRRKFNKCIKNIADICHSTDGMLTRIIIYGQVTLYYFNTKNKKLCSTRICDAKDPSGCYYKNTYTP